MSFYFRSVPDIDYVNRFPNAKISEYIRSKNLFTRVKIRDEIFQNLMYFEKYNVIGDERPDNVAQKFYKDPSFDWVVLLANNIVNVYDEWPLSQQSFENFLVEKYGTNDKINEVHHYESQEVLTSNGITILKEGLIVPSNYSVTFFDAGLGREVFKTNITDAVTNYQFEERINDAKSNIFIIKPDFLQLVVDDVVRAIEYKEGSTQFVSRTLKKTDNIRLFQ